MASEQNLKSRRSQRTSAEGAEKGDEADWDRCDLIWWADTLTLADLRYRGAIVNIITRARAPAE